MCLLPNVFQNFLGLIQMPFHKSHGSSVNILVFFPPPFSKKLFLGNYDHAFESYVLGLRCSSLRKRCCIQGLVRTFWSILGDSWAMCLNVPWCQNTKLLLSHPHVLLHFQSSGVCCSAISFHCMSGLREISKLCLHSILLQEIHTKNSPCAF